MVDLGKNIAGWCRYSFPAATVAEAGTNLTFMHSVRPSAQRSPLPHPLLPLCPLSMCLLPVPHSCFSYLPVLPPPHQPLQLQHADAAPGGLQEAIYSENNTIDHWIQPLTNGAYEQTVYIFNGSKTGQAFESGGFSRRRDCNCCCCTSFSVS